MAALVCGGWAVWSKAARAPLPAGLEWASTWQVYWHECIVWRPYPKNSILRVCTVDARWLDCARRLRLTGLAPLARSGEDLVVGLSSATGAVYALDRGRAQARVYRPDWSRRSAPGEPLGSVWPGWAVPRALLVAQGSGHVFLVAGAAGDGAAEGSSQARSLLIDLDGLAAARPIALPIAAESMRALWQGSGDLVVLAAEGEAQASVLEVDGSAALRGWTSVRLPAHPQLFASRSELLLVRDAAGGGPAGVIRWNWRTGERREGRIWPPAGQAVAVSPDGRSVAWFVAAPTVESPARVAVQDVQW